MISVIKNRSMARYVEQLPWGFLIIGMARASGYLRDFTLAIVFGLTPIADLFVYAFRLQLSLRAVFANETVNSLFVPAYLKNMSTEKRQTFFNQVFTSFLVLTLPLLIVLIALQPLFLSTFAPGFKTSKMVGLGSLIGIYSILSLIIISLSSLLISRLNSEKHFKQAFSVPLVYNVSLAIGILIAGMVNGERVAIHYLGGGFFAAALLQLAFSNYLAGIKGLKVSALDFEGLSRFWSAFSLWLRQASAKLLEPAPFLILFALATVHEGGATKLFLVERLILFIPSILGLYLASINTSKIGDLLRNGNFDAAKKASLKTFANGFLVASVCVPFVWLFSNPIVILLFEYGAFDEQASIQVSSLLKILVIALPFATGEYVLTQSLFAIKQFKAPVFASFMAVCIVAAVPIGLPSLTMEIANLAALLAAVYVIRVIILLVGLMISVPPPSAVNT